MGKRNRPAVIVPPISSPSEALELLRVAIKPRTGAAYRIQSLVAVRDWLERREREVADIEHGAAWLMLQGAQLVGEELRRKPRRKKSPSARLHLIEG